MKRPLIVGYGNPLCGDDALGWRAIELVRETLPQIDTLVVQQLTPELAEAIANAGAVVFIDAHAAGPVGQIVERELGAAESSSAISHQCTPAVVLAYARELHDAAPPALMLSAAGRCFLPGEGLSPEVAAAVPTLVRRAADWLAIAAAGRSDS